LYVLEPINIIFWKYDIKLLPNVSDRLHITFISSVPTILILYLKHYNISSILVAELVYYINKGSKVNFNLVQKLFVVGSDLEILVS
jgi:hypothetical protein